VDKEDAEIRVEAFRNHMARANSSHHQHWDEEDEEISNTLNVLGLEYSESFVAEQEQLISQIQQRARSPDTSSISHRPQVTTTRSTTISMAAGSTSFMPQAKASQKPKYKQRGIKIYDQARVHAAIKDGTATVILKCVGCSKHMVATKDVKLVFCPGCGTLSPVEIAQVPSRKATPLA
jgi:hypothetical protein